MQSRGTCPLVLLLLVVLLVGVLGVAQQPQVFTVLYNEIAEMPFREDWLILAEYQQRKNVRLEIQLGDDEDYAGDVANVLESGRAPDIILKVWPEDVETYAASGMLLAFSDYAEWMPYFAEYGDRWDLTEEIDRLRLADGKFYILPGFQRTAQVQQWIYRRDLFEKNGLGTPETYDELFDALVLLREADPSATPLTACWGGAHLLAMMGAGYGIPAGWAGDRLYDAVEDAWRYAPATEAFRELHRYLHRCYVTGILDPAMYTQSVEAYLEKLQDGRALVAVTWISSGFENWNRALREHGIADGEWAPLPVPESTVGIRALPAVDPFRKGLAVPARVAQEPYLEDLIRFLDWAVYSEEGMTLTAWGVEGVTYEENDTGRALLPHIASPRTPEGETSLTAAYGFATLFDLNENVEFEDYKRPDEIVVFLERSMAAGETAQPAPRLDLDSNALQAIDAIGPGLAAFATDASERFVLGVLDLETEWDVYMASLEERGFRTLEAIWNAVWAASP